MRKVSFIMTGINSSGIKLTVRYPPKSRHKEIGKNQANHIYIYIYISAQKLNKLSLSKYTNYNQHTCTKSSLSKDCQKLLKPSLLLKGLIIGSS